MGLINDTLGHDELGAGNASKNFMEGLKNTEIHVEDDQGATETYLE